MILKKNTPVILDELSFHQMSLALFRVYPRLRRYICFDKKTGRNPNWEKYSSIWDYVNVLD